MKHTVSDFSVFSKRMSWLGFCTSLLVIGIVVRADKQPDDFQASLAEGLMLYSSFDAESVAPDLAIGSDRQFASGPFAFEPGPRGKALTVKKSQNTGFSYWAYTNIHPRAGSVAFWLKPSFLKDAEGQQDIIQMAHVRLFTENHKLYWTAYIQNSQDRTSRYDDRYLVADIDKWDPNQWYHLAMSWDSASAGLSIQVYIDGNRTYHKFFPHEEIRVFKPSMTIGGGIKENNSKAKIELQQWTSVSFDELGVWERVLSATEIQQLVLKTQPALETKKQYALFRVNRAQTDVFDYIYSFGQTVHYDIELVATAGKAIDLDLYIEDFYGRRVLTLPKRQLKPSETSTLVGTFLPPGTGVYKLVAEACEKGTNHQKNYDLFSVSVVPALDYQSGDGSASFFGNHPDVGDYTGRAPNLTEARKIGVRWVRGLNFMQGTWWAMIEPQKGKFQWEKTDQAVALIKKNNMHVLGVLFATPRWATSAPASEPERWGYWCYPPDNFEDYKNYVRAVVGRYKDTIRHWEVWNEPWGGCWRGTPEQYVKLSQVTYETIKEIDPDIQVVGGGGAIVFQLGWYVKAYQAGLNKYQDIFSIHGYSDEFTPLSQDLMGKHGTFLGAIRELMKKYGGGEKPIWNSETGAFSSSFLRQAAPSLTVWREKSDFQKCTYDLIKYEVIQMADKVDRHFHYYMTRYPLNWHLDNPVSDNLMEYVDFAEAGNFSPVYVDLLTSGRAVRVGGGGVKPAGVAYAVLAKMIGGKHFLKQGLVDKKIRWFLFVDDSDRSLVVYWKESPEKKTSWTLTISPEKIKQYNVMGNPVTEANTKTLLLNVTEEPGYLEISGYAANDAVKLLTQHNKEIRN